MLDSKNSGKSASDKIGAGQPSSSLLGTRARTGIEWELLPGKEVGGFGAGKKWGAVEQWSCGAANH